MIQHDVKMECIYFDTQNEEMLVLTSSQPLKPGVLKFTTEIC